MNKTKATRQSPIYYNYKEFTVKLSSGKFVTVEYETSFVYDSNYGADADGNRASGMWIPDECGPTSEKSTWVDNDDKPITDKEQNEAMKLLNNMADAYAWIFEFPEHEYELEMEDDYRYKD